MKKSFLLPLIILASCIEPEEPPVGVIPKDTMVMMMVDIHLSEAKVSVRNPRPDSARYYYEVYRKKLYEKYKVSPERFDSSLNYYVRNVHEMDQLYEQVVDSLGLLENRRKLD